jgi:hypothetical protein
LPWMPRFYHHYFEGGCLYHWEDHGRDVIAIW